MLQQQATHVAIAFEVPGGWQKEKDAIVLTVLQVLILCLSLKEIVFLGFFSSSLLLYEEGRTK